MTRDRSSMSSTTSRRSAGTLSPVEHFAAYCRKLRLDNGERFELEPFQAEVAGDIFSGFSETWMIVPEGNGKTTFMAALALYHGDYTESAFVPIGASSREQAEILYRQAEGLVMRTPGLA
jgi:phage terminase large subunit-like protein